MVVRFNVCYHYIRNIPTRYSLWYEIQIYEWKRERVVNRVMCQLFMHTWVLHDDVVVVQRLANIIIIHLPIVYNIPTEHWRSGAMNSEWVNECARALAQPNEGEDAMWTMHIHTYTHIDTLPHIVFFQTFISRNHVPLLCTLCLCLWSFSHHIRLLVHWRRCVKAKVSQGQILYFYSWLVRRLPHVCMCVYACVWVCVCGHVQW